MHGRRTEISIEEYPTTGSTDNVNAVPVAQRAQQGNAGVHKSQEDHGNPTQNHQHYPMTQVIVVGVCCGRVRPLFFQQLFFFIDQLPSQSVFDQLPSQSYAPGCCGSMAHWMHQRVAMTTLSTVFLLKPPLLVAISMAEIKKRQNGPKHNICIWTC
jgi:hypothetical protein